jgi:hypothetical protein
MRNIPCTLFLAAAAVMVTSAAQSRPYVEQHNPAAPADVTAGVVSGTVIGLGISEGWWGATAADAALPTTAAGAAAVGGVAGIGMVAAIDSLVQPCRGFHALFNLSDGQCANGHYVGYLARHYYRRHE